MIYVYRETEDRYIITDTKKEEVCPVLVLRWESLSPNNIRPWKYLKNTRKNYYKPKVLDYLISHESEEIQPPEEQLIFVYRDQVESVFKDYTETLELFKSLELIKEIPTLKYNTTIKYSCDIKNYLEDELGGKLLSMCDDFMEAEDYKKKIIQNLGKLKTEEDKIKYLENKEIDNDIYQFLPPWLKVSYQVLGEGHKTIKREYTPGIEYDRSDQI